jgi:hypothetical protein
MIKVENNSVELKGTAPDLLAEYGMAASAIDEAFTEAGMEDKTVHRLVYDAVKLGLKKEPKAKPAKSPEEIAREEIKKALKELKETLEELAKGD